MRQVADNGRFDFAKRRFAVVGKDRGDQLAGAAFDLGVGVDRLAAQAAGDEPGDGRLAGAAVADQEDGGCGHVLNRKRSSFREMSFQRPDENRTGPMARLSVSRINWYGASGP